MLAHDYMKPDFEVFYVFDGEGDDKKDIWRKVGGAWKNQKDGYQVKLDIPVCATKLVMLPYKDRNEKEGDK